MSRCNFCHQDGLYFAEHRDPDGYVVLACTCPAGARWRVKHQLRAYSATLDPTPLWIGRLEEFFTPEQVATLTTVEREHPVVDGREQVGVGGSSSVRTHAGTAVPEAAQAKRIGVH